MARMIDADRLLRELTALSHGQVWPGWTYDGIRLLIERQPTLTQPNEWVRVEGKLPETAGEYLVVYHPCHWDNVSAEICVGIDSFRGKTAWAKKKYQHVTHWMPLPAPPAKEDQK